MCTLSMLLSCSRTAPCSAAACCPAAGESWTQNTVLPGPAVTRDPPAGLQLCSPRGHVSEDARHVVVSPAARARARAEDGSAAVAVLARARQAEVDTEH